MDFKNFDWSFKSIAKIIGIGILGILGLTIVIGIISMAFSTIFNRGGGYNDGVARYSLMEKAGAPMSDSDSVKSLNQRIVVPPAPSRPQGDQSENFEIREHTGTYRTRNLSETCGKIFALKQYDYVVFENANEAKESCSYSFKVKREQEAEILTLVQALNPENFNTQVQTIKKVIDDTDSELDILKKKLASVETTLADAQTAYDELKNLATKAKDVESLTKIIDSKLNLIEKLTQQRIEIRTEIDRYNKAKAEQLDRLQYAYFNLTVYEDLYFDWKEIKDSWKFQIKNFVFNVNELLQNLSVNLVEYVLRFLLVAIYFFISLFLLKGVWLVTKWIWKGREQNAH